MKTSTESWRTEVKPTLALLIASLLPIFAGAQDLSTADALKPAAKPNILVTLSGDLV